MSFPQRLNAARTYLHTGQPLAATPILAELLAHNPRHAEATHLLGLAEAQSGALASGLERMRKAITLAPGEPLFRVNLGLVLAETGDLAEAATVLSEAVTRWPQHVGALNLHGTVLFRLGRGDEAVALLERAVALAPRDDASHNNLGSVLSQSGRLEEATREFRRAVELNPANAMAHNNLAGVLREAGARDEAAASYRRALAAAPDHAMAWHNLGTLQREAGEVAEALASARQAVRAAPGQPAFWQLFADTVGFVPGADRLPGIDDDIAACLTRDNVDPAQLAGTALALLRARPRFAVVREAAASGRLTEDALAELTAPLWLALLERALLPDLEIEGLLARLRRASLEAWTGAHPPPGAATQWLAWLTALAQQCFMNEYVYPETPEEHERVAGLGGRAAAGVASADPAARIATALYGTYRALVELEAAAPADGASPYARLLTRQIREPLEERRLRTGIASLRPIVDPTTRDVQSQYETNPYPRWLWEPALVVADPLPLKLQRLFPVMRGAPPTVPAAPDILVAGCGTGRHAVVAAALNPDSRVLAVDISRPSLAYATRRTRELGFTNIEYAQSDLLELATLDRRFGLIECVGVLMHLADPLAGWRVLTGLLARGGVMKIGVYSAAARRAVVAAWALIESQGFAATPEGMRACRMAIAALPDDHPAKPVTGSLDFYSLSGCRDLLFHVRETLFTLTEIAAALDTLGLELLGFEHADPGVAEAYRAMFPGDREERSLDNWAAFEARHPETFHNMYQFWLRKRGEHDGR